VINPSDFGELQIGIGTGNRGRNMKQTKDGQIVSTDPNEFAIPSWWEEPPGRQLKPVAAFIT